jgi:DNA polymerase III epsilon subunit-like protein
MTKHYGLTVTITAPDWASADVQKAIRDQDVRLVSVDVETTGLTVTPGSVTEVGWFDIGAGVGGQFIPPHSIEGANPAALEVSRYHDRIAGSEMDAAQVAALHALLGGDGVKTVIVGSNPTFDQRHLAQMFTSAGLTAEPWERRAIDIGQGAFWAGIGGLHSVPGLATACEHFGVDNSNHHAALDDAIAAAQVFQALFARNFLP